MRNIIEYTPLSVSSIGDGATQTLYINTEDKCKAVTDNTATIHHVNIAHHLFIMQKMRARSKHLPRHEPHSLTACGVPAHELVAADAPCVVESREPVPGAGVGKPQSPALRSGRGFPW